MVYGVVLAGMVPAVVKECISMKWQYGDKARIARLVGISQAHLGDIIAGRKRPGVELAARISAACRECGKPISREDLLYRDESVNPLMGGKE